jgi:hypothetical protein
MIVGGDAHRHVEEQAAGDASNIGIYLNISGDGIEQSEDDADQQNHNADQDDNVYI